VRIFKTKWFIRWAEKEGIKDAKLCEAVILAERGQIDADLGKGVIKQRIARPDAGKSGGYRTVLYYRKADKAFFAYGFPKNERDNLKRDEIQDHKTLAVLMLNMTDQQIKTQLKSGKLQEVKCDAQS
jgi:hypothetical protein